MSLVALVRSSAAGAPSRSRLFSSSCGHVLSSVSARRSLLHRSDGAFVRPMAATRNAGEVWYDQSSQRPRYLADGRRTPFGTTTSLTMSEDTEPSSTATSASSFLSSEMHIFDVGDRVEVAIDGVLQQGVVAETRGSGWFTIRLTDTDELVKKRRGQLRYVGTGGGTTAGSISEGLSSGDGDEEIAMPTIVDLDHLLRSSTVPADHPAATQGIDLRQAAHHAKYDNWILFSDLHCSPSSISTCLEVLSTVHYEAVKRNAGIIFLGDFWHHRGTVRIDTLNAVLRAMSSWKVPLMMIPGNHDQVTLGGLEHGLTPLGNAYYVGDNTAEGVTTTMYPGPLIFTHPTKFRDALFVPYIRDSRIFQHVLESSASNSSLAQFVHVDVTGAYMNDLIVSQGGVPLSLFPKDSPIYSGHFHKPHTVTAPKAAPGVAVKYVGSPYQTSLSEAGQEKKLLLVDASCGWGLAETIPISVGKRYHRIFSASRLLDLDGVAAKDRVVVSMTRDEIEVAKRHISNDGLVSAFDAKIKHLRRIGASVEVREMKLAPLWPIGLEESEASDLAPVEDMTPENSLKAFLKQEMQRGFLDKDISEELLHAGTSLIEGMSINHDHAEASRAHKYNADGVTLEFTSVTAKGFGPFLHSVTYPLSNRGLVLLRGDNQDEGSDSNGSGKTTLAMAVLWALTGTSDPRPMQDSKVSDVINFDGKSARVAVEGRVNDVPFKVTRIKTLSKGSLSFTINDEDLTRQSIKDTQAVMDERLGISAQILARTIFHGQHAINGLLEATDATLKDELSLLVPLSVWQNAASFARKSHRSHSKRMSELDGMLSVREQDREALVQRSTAAKQSAEAYRKLFDTRRKQIEDHLQSLQASSANIVANETEIEEIRRNLATSASQVSDLESALDRLRANRDKDLQKLRMELDSNVADDKMLADDVQQQQRSLDRAMIDLERAKEKVRELQSMWGVTNVTDANTLDLPLTCPTCGQSIKDNKKEHSYSKLAAQIAQKITMAINLEQESQTKYSSLECAAASKAEEHGKFKKKLDAIRHDLEEKERVWMGKVKSAEAELKRSRYDLAEQSNVLQEAEKAYREAAVFESTQNAAISEIDRLERDSLSSEAAYKALAEDLRRMDNVIKQFEDERVNAERSSRTLTRLAEVFGPRGVQSFVLKNAVRSLSSFSQVYLDLLSDDTLKLELTLETGDRISRTAYIRSPDGSWVDRPLSSLSGGQWRRCSLALILGFTDLVAHQRNIRSSLLVLDEPLTHLDATGRAQVGKILRRLLHKTDSNDLDATRKLTTIIMILQDLAAEELEESFDSIDVVIRDDGISRVIVD